MIRSSHTSEIFKIRKVAVIGHFPYLEYLFEPYCDLFILDDDGLKGDYPLFAAEYIIPECDFVVITCGSLVLKTLPRYLELAKDAYTVIVGPATPLSPVLFNYGVQDMSGFVIKDHEMAERIITGGLFSSIYASGNKVHLLDSDWKKLAK